MLSCAQLAAFQPWISAAMVHNEAHHQHHSKPQNWVRAPPAGI